MNRLLLTTCRLSVLTALIASPAVHAQLYWDSNGSAAGAGATPTGTWGTSNFWNTDSLGGAGTFSTATANTDNLFFVAAPGAASANNAYVVTVSGAQVANSLTFQASGATTLSGGTSITLGDGTAGAGGITMNQFAYGAVAQGAVTISTALSLANSQTWTNNSANALTFGQVTLGSTLTFAGSGNFTATAASFGNAGAGGIIMNGTGVLNTRVATNTNYTGSTTINSGVVLLNAGSKSTGNFNLNGGMVTDYFQQTGAFTSGLGSGANQIQITGNSGFGAGNGTSIWRIGTAGSVLIWGASGEGSATGFFNPTTLKFMTAADNLGPTIYGLVNFDNGLNLNGVARTIDVLNASANPTTSGASIAGVISNGSLIKTGGGNLTLANAGNSYAGTTTISGGFLTVAATGALGSASNTLEFNGGTLRSTGTVTSPSTRAVTMTQTGIIDTNAQAIGIAGNIGGVGGLTKNSTGTLTLSGTNSYSGVTTVNAGTLAIAKQLSLYNNTPASWTAANLNVKSGATLALNVDSAGSAGFNVANLDTLLGNILVANTAAQGLQAGATLSLDTSTATGATFTLGNAITNSTGASGGVINLTKLGAGTLVLDEANTYTGTTTISAGTLRLDDGGSISAAPLLNNGTFAINRSTTTTLLSNIPALIGGTGSLDNVAAGTLVLNAPTYHTGNTSATVGNITLSHALAIQNSALNTTGAGFVTLSGATTPTFGGLSNSGTTRNLATVISTGYGSVTNLTLNPQSGITYTYDGIIADGATGMTLTKAGAGTQVLQGANSYTGATNINAGTLTLSGASGAIASTAINLNGGNLTLINVAGQSAVNRVSNSATITANGGTITWTNPSADNTANWAENIGTLSLSTGQTNIVSTNAVNAARTQILTLGAGSLTHPAANTSAITFSGASLGTTADDNNILITSQTDTAANQIIGSWATYGTSAAAQTDYAAYNITGGVVNTRGIQGAAIAASDQTTWGTAANAYTVNAGAAGTGSAGLTGTRTITALRSISGANAMTVDNVGNTFALTSNTFANGDAFTLGGTAPTGLTAGTTYYVVGKSGSTFQVAATPGGAAIDFSTNGTSVTATGAVTLYTGNNLETYGLLNGVANIMLVVANGTGALTTPTGGGNLHMNAGSGAITVSAPINNNGLGAVTLVKSGASILLLSSAASNYSGGTVINSGELRIASDAALGNSSGSITLNGGSFRGNNTNPQAGNGGGVSITSARDVIVGVAGGSIGAHGNNNFTTSGILSGSGTLTFLELGGAGGRSLNFNSTANTFTGRMVIPSIEQTLSVNSLADTAGSGNIALNLAAATTNTGSTFAYGAGATAPLTLNNRAFELNASGTFTGTIQNNNATQAISIGTNLIATGAGAKTLTLGAVAGPNNVFSGKITDGPGSVISLSVNGAGHWIVSGDNTYSGQTTVSGSTGAALTLSGNNSGMSGNVVLSTATGTVGSSPRLNINSATALGTGILNFGGGAATDVVRIDNTSAGAVNVSTANAITMNRDFTFVGTQNLNLGTGAITLGGMAANTARNITVTNNTLTLAGAIGDGPNGLSGIAKAGAGTLVLSGPNSYTGATSIAASGGTLRLAHASAVSGTPSITMVSGTILQVGTDTAFAGPRLVSTAGTIVSDRATAGAGLTHAFSGVSRLGSGNTNITAGTNVTSGTAAIQFASLDNDNGTVAGFGLNPTTANVIVVGGVNMGGGANAGTANFTLGGTGSVNSIGGAIVKGARATANLIKSGSSTWTLSGTGSDYNGTTTISGGTLVGIGANAFGNTTAISIAAASTATLSLRGDSSTNFVKTSDSSLYSVTTTANGATINVDQATITGTGAKTMTIGTLALNTAIDNATNFTGANNTSLSIGAVTTSAAAGGTETLTNNIASTGTLTLASLAVARTSGTQPTVLFNGTGNTTVTGNITQVVTTKLTMSGSGVLTLNGSNSYTGVTTITSGTLMLGSGGTTGSLSSTGLITNNGTLNFNRSDVITQGTAFGSLISGSGKIVQSGTGTTKLTGTNSFTGDTDILAGTLEATAVDALKSTSTINISGGTLLVSGSGNRINDAAGMVVTTNSTSVPALSLSGSVTESVGALTLNSAGTSVIDLGAGTAVFTFANSSGPSWSGLMQVWNWSGSLAGGGPDQLFFGNSGAGLTPAQLASITFVDPAGLGSGTYGAQLLTNGELVPVPEPSPLLAGGILLGIVGLQRRRKTVRRTV